MDQEKDTFQCQTFTFASVYYSIVDFWSSQHIYQSVHTPTLPLTARILSLHSGKYISWATRILDHLWSWRIPGVWSASPSPSLRCTRPGSGAKGWPHLHLLTPPTPKLEHDQALYQHTTPLPPPEMSQSHNNHVFGCGPAVSVCNI